MKICIGEWFTLPFLGKEAFGRLRGAGVAYEAQRGFCFLQSTDVMRACGIITSELGEEIFLTVKCFICGKPTECETCRYEDICDRAKVSSNCLCNEHFFDDKVDSKYLSTFESVAKEFACEPSENLNVTHPRNKRKEK